MICLLFWATWYPECEDMKRALERLAPETNHVKCCWTDVDTDKEIVDNYEVYKVPYALMIHVSKRFLFTV